MSLSIASLDTWITRSLNALLPHNEFFNELMLFFSAAGLYRFVWAACAVILIWALKKKGRKLIIPLALSSAGAYLLVEHLLKGLFGRVRPSELIEVLGKSCPANFSFPSGHAAVAFAAAAVAARFDKKHALLYYLLAGMVAFSRIYLGCHYFGDVIGGAGIGILLARMLNRAR